MKEEKRFNIIRFRGHPHTALVKGKRVYRQEKIFVPEYNGLIPCAPYDDHFIFENPHKNERGPIYQCTCGSVAIIVSFSGYIGEASPQGKMLLCQHHAYYGVHATGGSRWV